MEINKFVSFSVKLWLLPQEKRAKKSQARNNFLSLESRKHFELINYAKHKYLKKINTLKLIQPWTTSNSLDVLLFIVGVIEFMKLYLRQPQNFRRQRESREKYARMKPPSGITGNAATTCRGVGEVEWWNESCLLIEQSWFYAYRWGLQISICCIFHWFMLQERTCNLHSIMHESKDCNQFFIHIKLDCFVSTSNKFQIKYLTSEILLFQTKQQFSLQSDSKWKYWLLCLKYKHETLWLMEARETRQEVWQIFHVHVSCIHFSCSPPFFCCMYSEKHGMTSLCQWTSQLTRINDQLSDFSPSPLMMIEL